eukprot:1399554-Amphidinium_carterae.1
MGWGFVPLEEFMDYCSTINLHDPIDDLIPDHRRLDRAEIHRCLDCSDVQHSAECCGMIVLTRPTTPQNI